LPKNTLRRTIEICFDSTDFSENTKIAARPIKNQHSNIISALMCSNGYVKLPAEMYGEIKEGTIVDAYTTGLEYF